MKDIDIRPYEASFRAELLQLVVSAWAPVFDKTQKQAPTFIYDNFYPHGWETRQVDEVKELLDQDANNIYVALSGRKLVGFVGIKIHPEDNMGEIYIIAVAPSFQRRGIGRALMLYAEQQIRECGMAMVMVETVGDSGHEPARRTYEAQGYQRWPVARYFKSL